MDSATKNQMVSAVQAAGALAEAVRELGSVPSGHLYARVCGQMDMQTYSAIIGLLKRAGLVAEANHVLSWSGPQLENGK